MKRLPALSIILLGLLAAVNPYIIVPKYNYASVVYNETPMSHAQYSRNLGKATVLVKDIVNDDYQQGRGGHRYPGYIGGTYLDAYGNLGVLFVESL